MGGAPGGHPRQPGEPERSDRTVQLPRSAAEGFQRQHHAHGVGRADKTRRCGSGRAVAWWWARRLAISALSLLVPPGHPRASRRWIPCPPRLSRGGGTPRHAACSDAAMWRTNEARPGNQQVPGRQPSPLGASPAAEQVPLWGAGPRDAQPRQRFRLWTASGRLPVDCQWTGGADSGKQPVTTSNSVSVCTFLNHTGHAAQRRKRRRD